MHQSTFSKIQSPLQVDLDRIADSIVENLNVDIALLNLAHNANIVSMGLSSSTGRSENMRLHVPSDLVCLHVLDEDLPLAMEDAREEPSASKTRYVQNGTVAGYVGVPIRNAEIGPIGTICAITNERRVWASTDIQYLKAIALSVENLILREMYRLESAEASTLASEYDEIIVAFNLVRAEPTSIHDRSGRLVFANRALTDQIPQNELQADTIRSLLQSDMSDEPLAFLASTGERFSVTSKQTSSGYFVCQWRRAQSTLN